MNLNLIKNAFIAGVILGATFAAGWFAHKPSLTPDQCITRTLEVGGGPVRANYICNGEYPAGFEGPHQ